MEECGPPPAAAHAPLRAEGDGREESHDLPLTGVARLPSKAVVVLLGLSSTLVTVVFFAVLRNVWLTFVGVATVWVVVPLGWCRLNSAVKRIVATADIQEFLNQRSVSDCLHYTPHLLFYYKKLCQ